MDNSDILTALYEIKNFLDGCKSLHWHAALDAAIDITEKADALSKALQVGEQDVHYARKGER